MSETQSPTNSSRGVNAAIALNIGRSIPFMEIPRDYTTIFSFLQGQRLHFFRTVCRMTAKRRTVFRVLTLDADGELIVYSTEAELKRRIMVSTQVEKVFADFKQNRLAMHILGDRDLAFEFHQSRSNHPDANMRRFIMALQSFLREGVAVEKVSNAYELADHLDKVRKRPEDEVREIEAPVTDQAEETEAQESAGFRKSDADEGLALRGERRSSVAPISGNIPLSFAARRARRQHLDVNDDPFADSAVEVRSPPQNTEEVEASAHQSSASNGPLETETFRVRPPPVLRRADIDVDPMPADPLDSEDFGEPGGEQLLTMRLLLLETQNTVLGTELKEALDHLNLEESRLNEVSRRQSESKKRLLMCADAAVEREKDRATQRTQSNTLSSNLVTLVTYICKRQEMLQRVKQLRSEHLNASRKADEVYRNYYGLLPPDGSPLRAAGRNTCHHTSSVLQRPSAAKQSSTPTSYCAVLAERLAEAPTSLDYGSQCNVSEMIEETSHSERLSQPYHPSMVAFL